MQELGFTPEEDWRETMRARMMEDDSLLGGMTEKEALAMVEKLVNAVEKVRMRAGGAAISSLPVINKDKFVDSRASANSSVSSWHFMSQKAASLRKKPTLRRKKTITRPPPIDTDKIQSAYKSDDA